MALQTPRQRLQRPSDSNNLNQSILSASTSASRKASLQPKTPGSRMDADLEVGDTVNVPGDMYGTVKFVGSVRGKSGRFVGVELDGEFAARGKNDGDVDGTHYFHTSVPGSGIFLPIHRAEKRYSPAVSVDAFPATPGTPSYSTLNGQRTKADGAYTPPTPAISSKFSQSVGPGARPSSPHFKPKRPSLPRPESPLRKNAPTLLPPSAGRTLSQSQRGARPALSSTTPSKTNLKASTSGRTPSQTARPYSRTGSRLGNRPDAVEEEERTPVGVATTSNGRATSTSSVPSFSQPLRSPSRLGSAGGHDVEIQRLKAELAGRDKRLDEQAASLAEMEASVKELSALMPSESALPLGDAKRAMTIDADNDGQTVAQLRQMLREKNEKISLLTHEFDNHRADFRSTLDSLEMASTETERVYEEQKRELLARVAELEEVSQTKEDFDGVARQLKQLEDLVQELEEGLEESRRGEAEARGEVEFLRGEVERGRSELRREREKAAAAAKNGSHAVSPKELEQRDDEIRGLKAIIHSLSSGPSPSVQTNGHGEEVKHLEASLNEREKEKEALEQEVERLRRELATTGALGNGHIRNDSERTTLAPEGRARTYTSKKTFAERAKGERVEDGFSREQINGGNGVFCEMCQSREHDTLDCTKLPAPLAVNAVTPPATSTSADKENGAHVTASKLSDEDKWCALCEKDGHLAFDCPEEQY